MGVGQWGVEHRVDVTRGNPGQYWPDMRLLALAFLAGILIVVSLTQLPPLWLFVPALMSCLWRNPARLYFLALVAGAAWTTMLATHVLAQRLPVSADNTQFTVKGHIRGLPESGQYRTRFEFVTATRPHRLRLSWYDPHPALQPGNCWQLQLKVHAPHGSLNPGGFDYETWLWRNRIGATGYVRAAQPCTDTQVDRAARWRQRIAHKIDRTLAGHRMSGVVRALSVGERSGISDAQWTVLRHTGTSHLVAISGLHIGLIAALVLLLVRWLSPRLPGGRCVPAIVVGAVASAGAAGFYALLAGFALPTQRALVMLVVALSAIMLRKRTAPSNLLALAALAVLLLDPFAVLAPGFWLSFGAVAWILYCMRARVGARRWAAWLGLQPALVLALAPLTLYYFGEASLVAPLANGILIPAFAVVVPAVLFAVLLLLVWPAVGAPLLHAVANSLDVGWSGLQLLANLPAAHFALPQPSILTLILALLGIALLLAPRGIPGRWLGAVALLPMFVAPAAPLPNDFRLTVLDVGQGLSAVVRTAHHVLLFDAGPRYRTGFDAGEALVLPFLRARGVQRLDRFMVSHADMDHRGGAAAVRAGIAVGINEGARTARPCRADEQWQWDGVSFRVLHPNSAHWQGNNSSCVLRVTSRGGSVLLTGDIEALAEAHLVQTQNLAANVLVVPHHGSATSSTAAFIRAVNPKYAIFPAGWHNRWAFPRPPVIARYRAAGVHLLQTGTSGAVSVAIKSQAGVGAPKRWREQRKRFWHLP